jgi:hypothetical protein
MGGLDKLMDRLKELDIFDKSLLIITSDHGNSFEPGSRLRGNTKSAAGDTMPVPFFIKLPNQNAGNVSDENVEAIDVLPTIADILDIELPWIVDGQSMFDTSSPKRDTKTLVYRGEDGKLEQLIVSAKNGMKDKKLQNKLSIFGSGNTKHNGYYAIGPFGNLVGRKVDAISSSKDLNGSLTVEFEQHNSFKQVNVNQDGHIPIYVSGSVVEGAGSSDAINLAVSVNGTVEAVTRTYNEPSDKATRFYAMLPEHVLKSGVNEIEFYAILQGSDNQVHLLPVAQKNE